MQNDKKYSPEWRALYDLSKGNGLSELKEAQTDASLNKKINWFLKNGSGGLVVMIRDVFGKDSLESFYKFLNYYISLSDTNGHYHYSDTMKKDINIIENASQGIDFDKYLEQLKDELIKQDIEKKKRGI